MTTSDPAISRPNVAYFCMEYGLHTDLKLYAGGLGILAGDYLKGARDHERPIVGLGIKWKQGYTDQRIGDDGRPYDSYPVRQYDLLDTGVTAESNLVVGRITQVIPAETHYRVEIDCGEKLVAAVSRARHRELSLDVGHTVRATFSARSAHLIRRDRS